MERREFPRFIVGLKVAAKNETKESSLGLIKDFSRRGLRAVFDRFEFEFNSPLQLIIQRPDSGFYTPAIAEPVWKRPAQGKWDVGFRLKRFAPEKKAEILEYGYLKWLKENIYCS